MSASIYSIQPAFLHVRLPEPVMNEVKELADESGRTVSDLVRDLLKTELRKRGRSVSLTIKLV
jgi:hypothetical protein